MLERLKILSDNNVIDTDIYDTSVILHNSIMTEKGFVETEAYTVAMTHLAMAMHRVKNGEVVAEMDEAIVSDLKSQPCFKEVETVIHDIVSQFEFEVPLSEMQYLWLHFLNIYSEKGGCNEESSRRGTN